MAAVAALVGDPARANMLAAMLDGRARAATELAHLAGIAAPTASSHLAKLSRAKLIGFVAQGRHRYHRLASAEIGRMLEGIMVVAGELAPTIPPRNASDRSGAPPGANVLRPHCGRTRRSYRRWPGSVRRSSI
jgi:DNA-binding transcriptional ArsR family regulator